MSPEGLRDRVIEEIADGTSVDFDQLNAEVESDADREWAKALRLLNEIANIHRAGNDDREKTSASATKTAEAPGGLADGTPRAWGRYRLEQKLGEGSFGRVYRAWDPELERDVAIKILHRQVADAHLKSRILREGRALAKVRHPHVVNVLGIEAHEARVGLCMEFVRGETLANLVRTHGSFSAREATLIGEDLCRALSAVHRAGFIHRDVKARNVMREEAGRIVLMDFGTGTEADRSQARADVAGTPAYMAPEVLNEEPASQRSDVYSLGVLLYHLVTAAYPVEGRSMDEVRESHAQRRRRLLSERRPDLPVAFIRVVERAIAADTAERYASAGELLEALGTINFGSPTRSRFALPLRVAAAAGVLLAGLVALGAATSIAFNITLERSDFSEDTGSWPSVIVNWLVWGRRTSFAPFFVFGLSTLLGIGVLVGIRRLVLASSATARGFAKTVGDHFSNTAHRLRLDDASFVASCALTVSSLAIIAAWWYFMPLLTALLTRVSNGPAENLALLSPVFVPYHNQYRVIFSAVVLLSILVWYPVMKLIRKGQSLHWGLWAGGAVVTCVALFFLHFPYRLLYFNRVFEAVSWNGAYCYLIGEREDDSLLFCPEMQPPRNRIVRKDDETLMRSGITESIFTRFKTTWPNAGAGGGP